MSGTAMSDEREVTGLPPAMGIALGWRGESRSSGLRLPDIRHA
jgi:hypothetical protein